jgi:hypothetical protein
LFDASTAHWAKVEAVAGTPNCRAAALRSGKDATNVACFDAALSALREPIDVALGAAESFDAGIEQTLPGAGDKLSGKIDTLRDIALGRNPAEDQVKALWAAALRYTALYKNFETAASSDNKKKATDAWNTFIKSIDDH